MIKRFLYIVSVISFTCSLQFAFAQGTSVKASIDRNQILIGEPIHLTLEASLPFDAAGSWFMVDSIPHFEFIDKSKKDSVRKSESTSFKQVLTITSFDSGRWTIPPLALELNGRTYITDSFPVAVSYTAFDPTQDYHDIKDIFEWDDPSTRYVNWILAAITLLSLLAVIYFLRKRKTAGLPAATKNTWLTPVDEALQSLQDLQAQQLPEKGQVKLYYTRLNDILRLFIQRKFEKRTMEKTNEELLLQIKGMDMQNEKLLALAQTLRMSDAVKFAKYIPSADDNETSFHTTRSSIGILNNL